MMRGTLIGSLAETPVRTPWRQQDQADSGPTPPARQVGLPKNRSMCRRWRCLFQDPPQRAGRHPKSTTAPPRAPRRGLSRHSDETALHPAQHTVRHRPERAFHDWIPSQGRARALRKDQQEHNRPACQSPAIPPAKCCPQGGTGKNDSRSTSQITRFSPVRSQNRIWRQGSPRWQIGKGHSARSNRNNLCNPQRTNRSIEPSLSSCSSCAGIPERSGEAGRADRVRGLRPWRSRCGRRRVGPTGRTNLSTRTSTPARAGGAAPSAGPPHG